MASLRSLFLRSQHLRPSASSHLTTAASAVVVPARPSAKFSTSRPSTSSATTTTTTTSPQKRQPPLVPQPTPFIPDVETFLTVIGRGLKQHVSKFPTWESLFSLSSQQMRDLGVEPPRTRKYLLRWRQRFRLGLYGIGGDLQHVRDGAAELRVLEIERAAANAAANETAAAAVVSLPKKMRFVVNVPPGTRVEDVVGTPAAAEHMSRVRGYKVEGLKTIVGPYAIPLKGQAGAKVTVTEGMWEDKLGRKIDGGERRRTEVRYKKRIQERRQEREKAMSQK
ncbi:IGR protein motif-domain-containing protein [Microdochium trichocladiopsis]|uniref:Small ribosomal subunit protein mS41 n=1 Tax=Microdochium trichocladiopsis TaxID=1682393 RepID=A0A9P9BS20_9PEZI|nr:IGR protein motif-domain-containing protein [Microdochium trichocladiopsis]KAH7033298.1 IGR protein motif-domain-containing protein [Microdochium trichocladiopsis]